MTLYAVVGPADQTIVYRTKDGFYTTQPAEAQLFTSREEAEECKLDSDYIEEVTDEAAFRAQPDTW